MKTKPTHAALIAILIVLVAGLILIALSRASQHTTEIESPTATSTVATTSSPASVSTDTWKTGSDAAHTLTFKYPADLGTTYLHATEWPPVVNATSSATCVAKEDEMGRTQQRTIAGSSYCVTELAEGAAGSTYTTYDYVTQKGSKNVTAHFTLRAPQCDNYDEPKRSQCHAERDTFSVDDLVAKIVSTIEFK